MPTKTTLSQLPRSRACHALALFTALSLLAAGCSTTTRIVKREQRVARIKVESVPPGAVVLQGERSLGRTPTTAELRYTAQRREIKPGTHKLGWGVLISGIITLVGGIGLMALGAASSSDRDIGTSAGKILGYTFGGLLIATGLVATPIGGVIVGTTSSTVRVDEAVPASLDLALRFPGRRGSHALRISGKGRGVPPFDQLKKVRFDGATGTWQVPELPAQLKVRSKLDPQVGAVTVAPSAVPELVKPKPAASTRFIVAVFDIEDKGANLAEALRARLSDYLAMRLAALKKYNVVPRDQLRARLAKQKKGSYKSCYAQSCQIEIGKELAAQKSLATAIMRLGTRCTVSAVLYDLKSAASEGGATAAGGCTEDNIVASLESVVKQLAK
jgi:hypothetical protein